MMVGKNLTRALNSIEFLISAFTSAQYKFPIF